MRGNKKIFLNDRGDEQSAYLLALEDFFLLLVLNYTSRFDSSKRKQTNLSTRNDFLFILGSIRIGVLKKFCLAHFHIHKDFLMHFSIFSTIDMFLQIKQLSVFEFWCVSPMSCKLPHSRMQPLMPTVTQEWNQYLSSFWAFQREIASNRLSKRAPNYEIQGFNMF